VRKISETNSPADTKVSEQRGEEVLLLPEQRFLCSPWRRPRWGRYPPCCPWRWIYPEGTAAHGQPTLERVLLTGAASCGGPMLEQE